MSKTKELPDFGPRLALGPEVQAAAPGRARGTGQCDGVIFLGPRTNWRGTVIAPSQEDRALRYIRSHPLEWYALHERRGFDYPNDFYPLLREHNAEIGAKVAAASQTFEQPIIAMLLAGPHAVDCTQPRHLARWHLREIPGEEKIWALFYV